MKVWILVCGEAVRPLPKRCSGAVYEQISAALPESAIRPYEGPAMKAAGRPVYIAPGLRARETAEQMIPDAAFWVELRLAAIPKRAYTDGAGERVFRFWDRMAQRQARAGDPRQPESRKASIQRAEKLIDSLEKQGADVLLVAEESFLPILLDRFRRRGCAIQRSGIFRYKPFERILVSRRDEHCGGCGHNCLLANPGCDIGRDKAKRLGERRKA